RRRTRGDDRQTSRGTQDMPSARHSQTARRARSVTNTTHAYRGYVFTISYHAGEAAYCVDYPDFPEIITSGGTLAEAFGNACEALDLHLESLQKLGLPIPMPKHRLVVKTT